jgi:3-keto-disaccharide hydrolase
MRRCLLLLTAVAVICSTALARSDDFDTPEGFEPLFNGKDLTGWKVLNGNQSVWGAENGILFVNGKGGGWLMTEKEYSDFEIRLEFKLPPKGNSGVALRAPMKGDPAYAGMEIQILDDEWHKANYKGLRNVQLTGSIYDVVPPSKDANKPIGEWNKYRITAKGPHITVELNGVVVVDANLEDHKDRAKGPASALTRSHPGLLRKSGHLGLQSHDGRVEFRHIFVKQL